MESLHYLLMKANALFSRGILAEAGKLGLTSGQPKVLEFLLQHQEADQKTIAAHCEIEPATMGSILLRMEHAGLISRRQREGDRRSLLVSLTEQGKEAACRMADIFRAAEDRATAAFTAAELDALLKGLDRLCTAMQADRPRRRIHL